MLPRNHQESMDSPIAFDRRSDGFWRSLCLRMGEYPRVEMTFYSQDIDLRIYVLKEILSISVILPSEGWRSSQIDTAVEDEAAKDDEAEDTAGAEADALTGKGKAGAKDDALNAGRDAEEGRRTKN